MTARPRSLLDEGNYFDGEPVTAAEYAARTAAANHLRLYERLGNGLLIWRAFVEYRKRGLPIPEQILKVFDRYAAGLEHASGPVEIARTFELSAKGGGASGAAALKRMGREQEIATRVQFFLHVKVPRPPLAWPAPSQAYALVAAQFGCSPNAVQKAWERWKSRVEPDGVSLEDAFRIRRPSKPRTR
jgi:hypothetical protein